MPVGAETIALPAGYRLIRHDDIDSTNADAIRRLEAGAGAGEVVWARQQTAGRGRRGRPWQSPPGNLYMSLTVAVPEGRAAGQLAFVAALAAADAVRPVLQDGQLLACKWPNDLMLDDRKLGGILIEGAASLHVVGFGINVGSCPEAEGATCLARAGVQVTVPAFLQSVCENFDRWTPIWKAEGFLPVREAWLAQAWRLDDEIEARFPDGSAARGEFRGIDENGALLLGRDGGETRAIATGEVFFAAA